MNRDRAVVYKYKLDLRARFTLFTLPDPHRILHVGEDPNGDLCVWILHSYNVEGARDRAFFVFGTGHGIDQDELENMSFCGTAVMPPFVWHVFAKWRPGDKSL